MEIRKIPLSLVTPSPMNPRKTFDEGELQELADNIERQGLLQPITVRPIADRQKFAVMEGNADFHPEYEIICGERRFRAFSRLSDKWDVLDAVAPDGESFNRFSDIPAIVREMNDEEAFDAMITENLQRKDVDPIEEAFAFGELIKKGKTAEEIAARFGKSIRFVQDRVKLNNLIPELMLAVRDEQMSISAAMVIAKLTVEQQQKYHSSYSHNASGFTKQTADSFVNSLFMAIDKAPWHRTDADYEGGCNRKCAECEFNTANHGCLFWEMKTQDAGKCTDRERFQSKQLAFITEAIEKYDVPIIRSGEPLESGKAVIIDDDEWCSAPTKELKNKLYPALKAKGFEIIKANDIFEGKCWYTDERLAKNIEMGCVYRCIRFFEYDNVGLTTQWQYFKGKGKMLEQSAEETAPAASSQSADAMRLIQKRNRMRETAMDNMAAKLRAMAANLGEARRTGELSDAELFAFQILIFTLCGKEMQERYGYKGHGKPSDRSLINVIRQNRADWPLWIREFIRTQIESPDMNYNGLYRFCAESVLKEWMPKETTEIVRETGDKLLKALKKNEEQLNELGYDTKGQRLPEKQEENLSEPDENPSEPEVERITLPDNPNLIRQFTEMKKKHPDSILLFRLGDFYEIFGDDAVEASEVLGITLTRRMNGRAEAVQLAGFPHHALDQYIPKLVRAGKRVAICEQAEDPKK